MALQDIYDAMRRLGLGGPQGIRSPGVGGIYNGFAGAMGPRGQGSGLDNAQPGGGTGTGTHINPVNIAGKVHTRVSEQNPALMKYGPIDAQARWGGFGYKGGAKMDPITGRWGQPIFPYEWPNAQRETRWYKYKW